MFGKRPSLAQSPVRSKNSADPKTPAFQPRTVRKLESLVVHGFTRHPGGSSEALRQAAPDSDSSVDGWQEGLKPTRAAVAIIKSNATECRFSILGHVLVIRPTLRLHHRLDHVHWWSLVPLERRFTNRKPLHPVSPTDCKSA